VLGPQKGLELIENTPHAAGRITTIEGEQVKVFESKGFRDLVIEPE